MIKSGTSLYSPRTVVLAGGVRSGHTVVDMLCGHMGHIAIPAAELAGNDGNVYAVDVRSTALDSLKGRLQIGHRGNIELVRGDIERLGGVPLDGDIADAVMLIDTLSLTQNRLEVVKEAVRLLKSGGVLTVVDWHPYGDTALGPTSQMRLSEQEARSTCMVNDLKYQGKFDLGPTHYGFTLSKLVV